MRELRSQSAMEYLMTYGWAILIIAVVLAVLFQLGVFSGGNFLPHAQAGACQVSRTIAGASLEGQCNGMLPQFVAFFNGGAGITTGSSSYLPTSDNPRTITAWVKSTVADGNGAIAGWGTPYTAQVSNDASYITECSNGEICWWGSSDDIYDSASVIPNNSWVFVAGEYPVGVTTSGEVWLGNANDITGLNGGTPLNTPPAMPANVLNIGWAGWPGSFTGYIANVQVYNTTLSQSEIQTLYLEGIGGAPIRPQNLVGWWPLNGNANDYSGNNNNGQLNSVTFSSSWESGYAAP